MRWSRFLIQTLRENPQDAEIDSHRLLVRAGLVRKIAGGLYAYLPLGMRVLRKIQDIVREEMVRAGALEIAMPMVQPADLWRESGRYVKYGPELCRLKDRKQNEYVLGPTHEEIVTDIARREIKSARQLPLTLFQIQNKFRDEVRPRFGVMRTREFLMKDAYSFHLTLDSLKETYEVMHKAYTRVFERMGLTFRPVVADNGSIGGSSSHEFQALADAGEDLIAWSDGSNYAANIEMAEVLMPQGERAAPKESLEKKPTPGCHTVDDAAGALKMESPQVLKSLVVRSAPRQDGSHELIMLCLRGNQTLNEVKAGKIKGLSAPLEMASAEEIHAKTGAGPGSLGPVGFSGRIIIDRACTLMSDFACGANEDGFHYTGVNWDRDVTGFEIADLRNIEDGDPSPDGKGTIHLRRGIEVGQIFMLGNRYSKAMGATVTGTDGQPIPLFMGCYGIGVTRAIAAVIEQNHDEHGIIWPVTLTPFEVAVIAIRPGSSEQVKKAAEDLVAALEAGGLKVLYDDRDERPGVMFTDMELIGIPYQVVIGDKGLNDGSVELRHRRDGRRENLPLTEAPAAIIKLVEQAYLAAAEKVTC